MTHFADHSERFSHDMINRHLKGDRITPHLVWENVQPYIVPSEDGYVLFDDTVLDKRHSFNIAPMEVTEHNGSIELWPGSHLDTNVALSDATIKVDEQLIEARREIAPPVRGNTKKGSVLIRDMRLWHRGMPNHSYRPRQMIAMCHNIHWFRRRKRLRFNKGCEAVFENCQLDPNVEFTDEPIDYIFRNRPYDYHEDRNMRKSK